MPDDIKLESLSLLAKIYSNQNQYASAITLLQQAYDLSSQQPYWHCRIIFQMIVKKTALIFLKNSNEIFVLEYLSFARRL
jgi:hypothetical protein